MVSYTPRPLYRSEKSPLAPSLYENGWAISTLRTREKKSPACSRQNMSILLCIYAILLLHNYVLWFGYYNKLLIYFRYHHSAVFVKSQVLCFFVLSFNFSYFLRLANCV